MTSAVHSQTRTQRPCRGGFLTSHSRRHDVRKVIDFRFVTSKVRSIDGFWLRIGWSFLFFNSFFLFFVCCLLTGTYKFPFSSMGRCLTQLGKFSGWKKKFWKRKRGKLGNIAKGWKIMNERVLRYNYVFQKMYELVLSLLYFKFVNQWLIFSTQCSDFIMTLVWTETTIYEVLSNWKMGRKEMGMRGDAHI